MLEYVSFNPSTRAGSKIASYPWSAPSGSLGPLAVDLVNSRIIALATATTSGTTHTVNLFDLTTLTNSANTPAGSINLAAGNPNPTGSGSVAITPDGSFAFVLDSQNGITAYELNVKSAVLPLAAATGSIAVGPGSNYTIRYSGGEAINYVLLKSLDGKRPDEHVDRGSDQQRRVEQQQLRRHTQRRAHLLPRQQPRLLDCPARSADSRERQRVCLKADASSLTR